MTPRSSESSADIKNIVPSSADGRRQTADGRRQTADGRTGIRLPTTRPHRPASTDHRRPSTDVMTPSQFRQIALGMDGAIDASHMRHPDFRANGRIFATIHPDNTQGGLMLTPEQQSTFMREHPKMFVPAPGKWGLGGATMLQFAAADQEVAGEAVTLAWQNAMAKESRQTGTGRRQTKSAAKKRR